jgi:hypothetical protein
MRGDEERINLTITPETQIENQAGRLARFEGDEQLTHECARRDFFGLTVVGPGEVTFERQEFTLQ